MISPDIRKLIINLRKEGYSYSQIADIAKISKSTAHSIVNGSHKVQKKKPGPKSLLKRADLTSIKRRVNILEDAGERVTANKIREECNLTHIHTRTMRRAIAKLGGSYKEASKEIKLTSTQKKERVRLATYWLDETWPWHRVVWSDEKRFNLDGPDSWKSWTFNDQGPKRNKRQQGGGTLQIWGMLLPDGTLVYKELDQRGTSEDYIALLRDFAKPILDDELNGDYIFQQDNASTHTAKRVKDWMESINMPIMDWPAKSPDLSPIENVWALLSGIIYDGPQFKNKRDLRRSIEQAVERINTRDRSKVMNIRDSIQKRLRLVIQSRGAKVNY